MPGALTALDVVAALVGIYLVHALLVRSKRRAPLPPGPKGLPLIGNVLDMPKELEWLKFSQWNDQYGNIVHLNLLGQSMVIIGSYKDAVALLEKRSAIYSDRPRLVMGGELVGWDQTLSLLPYGDRLREHRRMAHKLFGTRNQVRQYYDMEEHETKKFLRRVLKSPEDLAQHIRKTAGSIILKLTYGYDVQEGDDPLVDVVDHAIMQFSDAVAPGAFLVDIIPWLRHIPAWMPGAGFLRTAREWNRTLQEMANTPHELVKKRMSDGTNIPNFTSRLLQDESLNSEKEADIKWAAASLYAGGADTTVSAIHSFFLAMTIHPEVLKRAQAEIDSVVGTDRLPSLSDRPNLPYVEAVVKEVLRWNPVGPLGVPHRLTEDDIYEGYLIPKGSIVIANLWRMLHDPETYGPNPLEFDPSRHLGEQPAQDPKDSCFGFGRRICPGMLLADGSTWISCAMTIAAFDISTVKENGKVVEPEVAYTSGTISHPKPFKCNIRPRSEKTEALILAIDEQ